VIVDYFAGSGTTGHAVVTLNREDGGSRQFVLVEMGAYFTTMVRPRIAKALYSPDWKDGKTCVHDGGISALVKSFAVESYEDALNNLPSPSPVGDLLAKADGAVHDAMLRHRSRCSSESLLAHCPM